MTKAYKYRLYPTKNQSKYIDTLIYQANQAYNQSIYLIQNKGRELYDKGIKGQDIVNELYSDVRSHLGQRGIYDKSAITQDELLHAYNSLFVNIKQKKSFNLHYKNSRKDGSFKLRNNFSFSDSYITIFNREKIKVKTHRGIPKDYRILGYRIKREIDEYYITINITNDTNPEKIENQSLTDIDFLGVDANQGHYDLSNGKKIEFNKKVNEKLETQRIKAQQSLSNKKKGSSNRKKAKIYLAKKSRKIVRNRTHNIHQRVNMLLTEKERVIVVEKLNIKKMTKSTIENKSMRKNMLNISHPQFFSILAYKLEQLNRFMIRVNPEYTSQMCSRCGSIKKMELKDRMYTCDSQDCGLNIDRDLNAAINIKRLGTSLYVSGSSNQ